MHYVHDNKGTVFSGSAIADRKNLLCLRKKETPLLLFYTAAGGTSRLSEGEPFSICLALFNRWRTDI